METKESIAKTMPICVLVLFEVNLQPWLIADTPEMQLQRIGRSVDHGA